VTLLKHVFPLFAIVLSLLIVSCNPTGVRTAVDTLTYMYGCPTQPEINVCKYWQGENARLSVDLSNLTSMCSDSQTPANYTCCVGYDCLVQGWIQNDHMTVWAEYDHITPVPSPPGNYFFSKKQWIVTPAKEAKVVDTNCDLPPPDSGNKYSAGKAITVTIHQIDFPEIVPCDQCTPQTPFPCDPCNPQTTTHKVYACHLYWTIGGEMYYEHFASDPPPSFDKLGCLGWVECVIP